MSKLIIDNQSDMPDDVALQYVITVIRDGRVKESAVFHDGVRVCVARNKSSFRFIVRGKA